MRLAPEEIPGVKMFSLRVHGDVRGTFVEQWREESSAVAGLPHFVQDNAVMSRCNVLRGMHYQHPGAQGKLVSAAYGEVFDVVVDVRRGSPAFGHWAACNLSGETGAQIYVPPGLAHGYVVMSDVAVVTYKCTAYYAPERERGLLWCDPELGIEWPMQSPLVMPRDAEAPPLRSIPVEHLPNFPG